MRYKGKEIPPEEFLNQGEIEARRSRLEIMIRRDLRLLANEYHLTYCLMCDIDDYDSRKPAERRVRLLDAIGRYLYEKEWNNYLMENFDWPTPKGIKGAAKTVSYKGAET